MSGFCKGYFLYSLTFLLVRKSIGAYWDILWADMQPFKRSFKVISLLLCFSNKPILVESLDVVISLLGSANLANVLLERANLAGAVISELCLKDMIETTSENLKKLSSRDSTTVGNSTTRKRWLGMIGGEDDKLVPWSHSQEFLSINPCNVVLKSWTQPGIGHKITPEMRTKCWQWLTEWKDSIQS